METGKKIIAKNEKEARSLALKEFISELGREIDEKDLSVRQVGEKKSGFLGLGGKKKVFEVILKSSNESGLTKKEEKFLDYASDTVSVDGQYSIKITDEGIKLRVSPPEGEGDPVRYHHVKEALDKKGIVEVDWQTVQEILHDQDNEWYVIAPRRPELDRDGEASVRISKDKLSAYITYIPSQGGKKLNVDDLYQILDESGVKYGIIDEKLQNIIKHREEVEDLLIAEGEPPTPGKDVQFNFHFETKKDSIGTKREDGSIDFYNLGLISNVEPGDVLVTRIPPQPGKPGKGVTGEELPPPKPRDKELPGGKNVERKDENTLVAKIAGQVVKDGNKISVLPIYEVNGNVDLSVGNIDFLGNVIVKGDVLEGFKIEATGNVEIRGNVDAAEIEAGGDVVINKGFIGKGKGEIKARGDVKVKFVENGIIKSDQNIIISDAVMHSQLIAGDSIVVKERKGLLVGGIAKARKKIEANIFGSTLATITKLEVGVDPELKGKLKELEEQVKKERQNLNKTTKALNILEKLKTQQGKLPQDKEMMYYRLKKTVKKLKQLIEQKEGDIANIGDRMRKEDNSRIVVNSRIFPGVKITIGNAQMNVRDEMSRTSFVESEGEVRQVPL